jgi:hypothetical protein
MPFLRTILRIVAILACGVLLTFTCWVFAAGCSRAHIIVTNQSGTTVSNLAISGSCKERHVDVLATQSEWLTVTPYDNGIMRFSFECDGSRYTTNTELHSAFLGVIYTISTNMIVTVQTRG